MEGRWGRERREREERRRKKRWRRGGISASKMLPKPSHYSFDSHASVVLGRRLQPCHHDPRETKCRIGTPSVLKSPAGTSHCEYSRSTAGLTVYHTQIITLCPSTGQRKEIEGKEPCGEVSSMEALQPSPTPSGYYVLRWRREGSRQHGRLSVAWKTQTSLPRAPAATNSFTRVNDFCEMFLLLPLTFKATSLSCNFKEVAVKFLFFCNKTAPSAARH